MAALAFGRRRLRELKSDSSTTEMWERIFAQFRVQDRNGFGKRVCNFVMISNDDIDSLFFCKRDRLDRGRSHVNGDDELNVACGKRFYRFRMKSVSFPVAMRDRKS